VSLGNEGGHLAHVGRAGLATDLGAIKSSRLVSGLVDLPSSPTPSRRVVAITQNERLDGGAAGADPPLRMGTPCRAGQGKDQRCRDVRGDSKLGPRPGGYLAWRVRLFATADG